MGGSFWFSTRNRVSFFSNLKFLKSPSLLIANLTEAHETVVSSHALVRIFHVKVKKETVPVPRTG